MPKGKRRHGPPPGYMTSAEAIRKLGKMLYKHVKAGRIEKIKPQGYSQGFYKIEDVQRLVDEEAIFEANPYTAGRWKDNPTCTFERASIDDMPAIFEISRVTFDAPITPELAEIRRGWLRKSPETYHVVRNQAGTIVAYASLAPLPEQMIALFVRDELDIAAITPDDIKPFEPDKPLHIYIMAVAVDPQYSPAEKHEYGARLVSGLFSFLLDLAQRGVAIETITARTYKPDGLRLLRKLGIPQMHSPVPGKSLFRVVVADSGFPLFERYSELLATWQHSRPQRQQTPSPVTPIAHTPQRDKATVAPRTPHQGATSQPPDTLTLQELAARVQRDDKTVLSHLRKFDKEPEKYPQFEHVRIAVEARPGQYSRFFTPEQAERIAGWIQQHSRK